MNLLFLLLALGGPVPDDAPSIHDWVEDGMALLTLAEKETIRQKLIGLEKADGTQIVVLIVPTTSPYSIEDFSFRAATKARIGQKGLDNGVLITVAKDDRKVRIEVGKGLEGKLMDAVCSWIIRYDMVPQFKKGNYFQGLSDGVDKVIQAVKGTFTVREVEIDQTALKNMVTAFIVSACVMYVVAISGGGWLIRVLAAILALALVSCFSKTTSWTFLFGAWIVGSLAGFIWGKKSRSLTRNRGYGGGYFGGGWGSSGGGGGFSGGGGSFGGGGASGSW